MTVGLETIRRMRLFSSEKHPGYVSVLLAVGLLLFPPLGQVVIAGPIPAERIPVQPETRSTPRTSTPNQSGNQPFHEYAPELLTRNDLAAYVAHPPVARYAGNHRLILRRAATVVAVYLIWIILRGLFSILGLY